ncbi:MAG: citramalate synthase [Thermoflexales bacterium]|nr:citramalate synthase [Thermoflexales bacterium]
MFETGGCVTKVALYDTTLRDGAQAEGISFSVDDKLKIARQLDRLGISYIEGGWPGSNPKDMAFFEQALELELAQAVVTAFGSTRRAGAAVDEDANVRALVTAGTAAVTLVGKSWDLHVREVLRTTLEENLRMIADSVRYLKSKGREVIYDAEHFFDGYRADPVYAMQTLAAAAEAGASVLVLCDTNGGSLPGVLAAAIRAVQQDTTTPLGIHAHNDSETAVANSLIAVEAGVVHVQGTLNGYGERCGNANLCSIIPALKLKLGIDCIGDEQLRSLTATARYVSELANMQLASHLPYVGNSAFAHKGGIHVDAMVKCAESYQHIDPSLVGNQQRIVVSELAGKSSIAYKASQFGVELAGGTEQARQVLQRIKNLESQGFQFEGAEGSVELLMRRLQPGYTPPFKLIDFHVLIHDSHDNGGGMEAVATVKVQVGDHVMHTAADGNGPVNALDAAVRKALLPFYPSLAEVQLTDYKVRILDGEEGTSAQTRVLIDSASGARSWSTVGSSTNIIEASWQALADSLEYALLPETQQDPKGP